MGEGLTYQEVQAILGATSAHPGSFMATRQFLAYLRIPREASILECGCGTGRTACYLAKHGLKVIAIDQNPRMVDKARRRGLQEQVAVEWLTAEIQALPFPDRQFDLVLAESVTIFNDLPAALSEYLRVLKPGGRVADLEMAALPGLSPAAAQEVRAFFGLASLPTFGGWRDAYLAAGFSPVRLWRPRRIDLCGPQKSQRRYPELILLDDPGAYEDPRVTDVLAENAVVMATHYRSLGYTGIVATRSVI